MHLYKTLLLMMASTNLAAITLTDIARLKERSASPQAIIAAFTLAIKQDDNNADLHHEFGNYLAGFDNPDYYDQTCQHLHEAVKLRPNDLNWLFEYAVFCCRIGHIQESLEAYKTILTNRPSVISAIYNSAYTLKAAGYNDLAIALYRKILSLSPDHDQAHLGLAFALISSGAYKAGWQEHGWNLTKQGKYAPELRMLIAQNNVVGKRILLLPEGGIGDTLNFVRYAQRLRALGAYTIVAVQPALSTLLRNCPYIDELITTNDRRPACDAAATLMSLPAIFADDEETIPRNIPYIFPAQNRISYWREKLSAERKYKIGICWQPDVYNDSSRLPIARRGIALKQLAQLAQSHPIQLYSLQQKEGLDQLKDIPAGTVITFGSDFDVTYGSFVDTAAVMQSLDLIISTDTATAHLAGALGKKVWLLVPYSTDWRWLLNRTDTPWYPTMRIFKQPHPFDWDSVIQELQEALKGEMEE